MSTRSYVPTSVELNEAIAQCLVELESQDSNDVRSYLLQMHRTWRLPERRVRKFVKRQTGFGTDTDSVMTEDDAVSVTSVRSRVMGLVGDTAGRLFGTKPVDRMTDAQPVFEIETTRSLLSQMIIETDILSPIREAHTPAYEDLTPDGASPEERNRSVSDVETPRVILAERFLESERNSNDKTNGAADTLDVYRDDNDGKRDDRCGLCQGCVVI